MRNIFKTFKENKILLEENKILKAQNESLEHFRKDFSDYYHDISSTKIITKNYSNTVELIGHFTLDNNSIYCPTDECRDRIIYALSKQLMPFIEFDIVDNRAYGTKDIVGRLSVLQK
jgi:hypothetical protein